MKAIKRLFPVLLLITLGASAQDRSNLYTNLLNPFLYNPALAGSNANIYTILDARSVIGGIDGSARSYNFAIHSPMANGTGLGAKILTSSVGAFQTINAEAAYSKLIKLNEQHSITFGLSLGFTQTNIKTDLLNGQVDLSDPSIMSKDLNRLLLSSGAGTVYRYKNLAEIGISFPDLITGDNPLNGLMVANGAWNFYAGSKKEWKIKPMVNYYNLPRSPAMVDMLLGGTWNDLLSLTGGFRTNGSVIFSGGLNFKSLAVNYAYYYFTDDLVSLAPAQNEIALAFLFSRPKIADKKKPASDNP